MSTLLVTSSVIMATLPDVKSSPKRRNLRQGGSALLNGRDSASGWQGHELVTGTAVLWSCRNAAVSSWSDWRSTAVSVAFRVFKVDYKKDFNQWKS